LWLAGKVLITLQFLQLSCGLHFHKPSLNMFF
jgi:hypothetical protein